MNDAIRQLGYLDEADVQAHMGLRIGEVRALVSTGELARVRGRYMAGEDVDGLVADILARSSALAAEARAADRAAHEQSVRAQGAAEELAWAKLASFKRAPAPLNWPHLYVIEIIGVGTKVGITTVLDGRLRAHRRDARSYRREVGRVWVSVRHRNARWNEYIVVQNETHGTEYLDAGFDAVVAMVDVLSFDTAQDELEES